VTLFPITARRAIVAAALLVVVGEPFIFAQAFAGDAEVHLVFAESASRGRFFEFNPGEPVSGETSPGYMLLGAVLFKVMPAALVPLALKIVGIVAWYALCGLVLCVATRLLRNDGTTSERAWAAIAAVGAAAMPGSVYNANVGMENGIFAALVWWWVLLAARRNWFDSKDGPARREIVMASLLGIACWVRPEGAIVIGVAYAFRLSRARPPLRSWLPGLLVAVAIGGACVAFQFACTGDLIATSMLSRRVLAMPNTFGLGGSIAVDPTFAKRLLVYFPLTALYVVGLLSKASPATATERFLAILLATFFVIYSLSGAPQLGRYLIFLMPILAIGAVRGARTAWRSAEHRVRIAVVLAAIGMIAIDAIEPYYRVLPYYRKALSFAMAVPQDRQRSTDEMFRGLGDPTKRPVVIACESVQLRYRTDDRILVRSLDGRADRALLEYVHGGAVDHIGYLRERQVDYITEAPDYNRDSVAWSLRSLLALRPNDVARQDGMSFERVPRIRAYKVISQ
jgi:hypothetical protein